MKLELNLKYRWKNLAENLSYGALCQISSMQNHVLWIVVEKMSVILSFKNSAKNSHFDVESSHNRSFTGLRFKVVENKSF